MGFWDRFRTMGAAAASGGERDGRAATVLAAVRAAGSAVERVDFTRNRRVMASLADRGRALRVHECFAEAPGEVLRALGQLFSRAPAVRRDAARERVREYLRVASPAPSATPPKRGARRIPPSDRPHLDRLRAEFERVNAEHFDGELPDVPLFLSGRMTRRNGHFSPSPVEIVLARQLLTLADPGEAEQTLRHEMIHLWQHATGRKLGHGADFRRLARRLGVHPRAMRTVRWAAPRA